MAFGLLLTGALLCGMTAFFVVLVLLLRRRVLARRGLVRQATGATDLLGSHSASLEVTGFSAHVIEMLVKRSHLTGSSPMPRGMRVWSLGLASVGDLLEKAGLSGLVDVHSVATLRRDLSLLLGLGGLLVGLVFSEMLAMLLLIVGGFMGWRIPLSAIRHERDCRTNAVEADLARMLEVVVLGLRGGLSFDRALSYFGRYFEGSLARSCVLAQTQWTFGLRSRDDALRSLSSSHDSKLLARTIESISRSLRYGTSLADDLTDAAASARSQRRAKLEEAVAKAPVKMLLPVGGLILPAMLMLVVGPILLELMEGF